MHGLCLPQQQSQERNEQQHAGQVENGGQQVEHAIEHREPGIRPPEAQDAEEVLHAKRQRYLGGEGNAAICQFANLPTCQLTNLPT